MGGFLYTLFNTGYCSMTLGQGLFVAFVTLFLGMIGGYIAHYFRNREEKYVLGEGELLPFDHNYRQRGYGGKSESPRGRTIVHVNCDGGEGCPYPLDHKV